MSKNQLSEKDMLLDSIMTERYVSSVYDTGVMESVNEEVIKPYSISSKKSKPYQAFMEVMHNKDGMMLRLPI